MRSEMAQPCWGSRASARRISKSNVPCGRSILLSLICASPCASTGDNTTSLVEAQGVRSLANSAPSSVKFPHEASEGLNGFESHGVVKRDTHAADGTVAGSSGKTSSGGFVGKPLFNGFVSAGDAENDVHLRARGLLHWAVVEPYAGFDGVVKEFSFRVVALLNARDSSERFNPFENQADDINRERRRRMVQRFVFHVRAVLKNCRKILVRAFSQVFANDHNGDAGRAEILLRAGKNESKFLNIDGMRSNVGRHVGNKRHGAGFRNGGPLRAFDGVVGADVHVRRVGREFNFVGAW